MGTPDFAVTALSAIFSEYKNDLIGVVTRTDTPKNRGHVMLPPPVKVAAEKMGIPVFQPQNLKEEIFGETLRALSPDVIIVAAYGKLLPKYVLDFPKHGCINIHASLLPEYRGAAPIARAIMDGKKELGITIMYMEEGLDTGDMIMSSSLTFENKENKGEIEEKLSELGADMIVETLGKLCRGEKLETKKQDDEKSNYAAKIEKSDCEIDFSRSAMEIENLVRALSPAPYAFTTLNGKNIKIAKVHAENDGSHEDYGTVTEMNAKGDGKIKVAAKDGSVFIDRLIPEGKKEMSAGDFVRGRGINTGDILGKKEKE